VQTCKIVSMLSFGERLAITLGRMKSPMRVWDRKEAIDTQDMYMCWGTMGCHGDSCCYASVPCASMRKVCVPFWVRTTLCTCQSNHAQISQKKRKTSIQAQPATCVSILFYLITLLFSDFLRVVSRTLRKFMK
jgi:hypothetical protein